MTDKELLKDILPYLKEYFESEDFKKDAHELIAKLEELLKEHTKCEGWRLYIRSGQQRCYQVPVNTFKYCPWCGKEIK